MLIIAHRRGVVVTNMKTIAVDHHCVAARLLVARLENVASSVIDAAYTHLGAENGQRAKFLTKRLLV